MIYLNMLWGGGKTPVKSNSYHFYKILKTSIFILPIFCFFFEKDCYSFDKEKVQEVYNRFKNELENYRNPGYYNTFRLTPAYKDCLSISFNSDDDAEIERNRNKLNECLRNFKAHAEEYIQRDFSEYVEMKLNDIRIYGNNFKCTRDIGIYYNCESDEYKCYSSYDPSEKIFDFDKGTCTPTSEKEEKAKKETLSKENKPVENGLKWYDKKIEDYTDSDAADYINSRHLYDGEFSCTKKGNAILSWDCSNGKFYCLVYKMKAYSSLNHSCRAE